MGQAQLEAQRAWELLIQFLQVGLPSWRAGGEWGRVDLGDDGRWMMEVQGASKN